MPFRKVILYRCKYTKFSGEMQAFRSKKASFITPVPGGVGPMTIAMIFENIIETLEEK